MKMNFSYNKFSSDTQNTLVDSFVALCEATIAGKQNTAEYKEANLQFNAEFMKECASAMPGYNAETFSLNDLKNPMISGDMFFLHRFDAILAQMITPVVPMVIAAGYENLYDVTQVGFGDVAKYTVDSNEMFIGATCSYITLIV